jgi:hypothetical protein
MKTRRNSLFSLTTFCFFVLGIWATTAIIAVESAAKQDGCIVRLELGRDARFVGDQVLIKVIFENHGTNIVNFLEKSPADSGLLEVSLSNGVAAELTAYGRRMRSEFRPSSLRTIPVPPGASWTNSIVVSRIFDMTIPDAYTITATCAAAESAMKSSPLQVRLDEKSPTPEVWK